MSATPPLLGSVVDQLGAEIVSGDLAEGERFRLGDVEKRFGISRTVAREAMRRAIHKLPMKARIVRREGGE